MIRTSSSCLRCLHLRRWLAGGLLLIASDIGLQASPINTPHFTFNDAAPAMANADETSVSSPSKNSPTINTSTTPDSLHQANTPDSINPPQSNPSTPEVTNRCVISSPAICTDQSPLMQMNASSFRLPSAAIGRAYRHILAGRGGQSPYQYSLISGALPEGLIVSDTGIISGQPEKTGTAHFKIRMRDLNQHWVDQDYTLSVYSPKATPPSTSTPALSLSTELTTLSAQQARTPLAAPEITHVTVYQLQPELIDQLKPPKAPAADPAPESGAAIDDNPESNSSSDIANSTTTSTTKTEPDDSDAAPTAMTTPPGLIDAAQADQVKAIIQPLLGVEYPNRASFTAALDAQLCRYVHKLILQTVAQGPTRAPDDATFNAACPGDNASVVPAKSGSIGNSKSTSANLPETAPIDLPEKIAWQDLPKAILPPQLRNWLIESAAQDRQLLPWNSAPSINWTGNHCGCVLSDLTGEIYGFYPQWWAENAAQTLDFSLMTRISYFALPFDANGALTPPPLNDAKVMAFVRTARRFGTHLDISLYRNDWAFLDTLSANAQHTLITHLSQQAKTIIDAPLTDWASRAKAWVPGFAETQRVADGITVFLDSAPDIKTEAARHSHYVEFTHELVNTLIETLQQGDRPYALNLVINDQSLDRADSEWTINFLFDALKKSDNPEITDQRIQSDTVHYHSRTNVTLYYLILLSEPTTNTKKRLHSLIESSPVLHGSNRRLFLRKSIPILATGIPDAVQFGDDIAYFDDNFGGTGFWPTPIQGVTTATYEQLSVIRNNFHPLENRLHTFTTRICAWICEYRWPLRVILELLLLIGIISIALYYASCRIRQLGSIYQAYLLLGAIPTTLLGGLLLECDPALHAIREGNAPLILLILLLVISSLYLLLKPRVELP